MSDASTRTVAPVGTLVDVLTRIRLAVWAPGVETGAREPDGHLRLYRTFELDVWVPGFVVTEVAADRRLSVQPVDGVGGGRRMVPSSAVRSSHAAAVEATPANSSQSVVPSTPSAHGRTIEADMSRHIAKSRRRDFGPDGRIGASFRPFAIGTWPWWSWS